MKEKKKKFKMPVIEFKKYRGKQLAIIEGKIAATGNSTTEVLKKAKERYPKKANHEFLLVSVPREEVFIYFYD